MKKGFTLIELLVVVLIIGILSAIALPQYQKAVDKARISTYIPLLQRIRHAQQIYHMNNNEYATDLSTLDIDPSPVCPQYSNKNNYMLINCNGGVVIDNQQAYGKPVGDLILYYCPDLAGNITPSNYQSCQNSAILYLELAYNYPTAMSCTHSNTRGQRLCNSLRF